MCIICFNAGASALAPPIPRSLSAQAKRKGGCKCEALFQRWSYTSRGQHQHCPRHKHKGIQIHTNTYLHTPQTKDMRIHEHKHVYEHVYMHTPMHVHTHTRSHRHANPAPPEYSFTCLFTCLSLYTCDMHDLPSRFNVVRCGFCFSTKASASAPATARARSVSGSWK